MRLSAKEILTIIKSYKSTFPECKEDNDPEYIESFKRQYTHPKVDLTITWDDDVVLTWVKDNEFNQVIVTSFDHFQHTVDKNLM